MIVFLDFLNQQKATICSVFYNLPEFTCPGESVNGTEAGLCKVVIN